MILPPDSLYETSLLHMLRHFSIQNTTHDVKVEIKDPTSEKYTKISMKQLMLKAMNHNDPSLEDNQQDAGECMSFLLSRVPQLGFLKHKIRDEFTCTGCKYGSSTDEEIQLFVLKYLRQNLWIRRKDLMPKMQFQIIFIVQRYLIVLAIVVL